MYKSPGRIYLSHSSFLQRVELEKRCAPSNLGASRKSYLSFEPALASCSQGALEGVLVYSGSFI